MPLAAADGVLALREEVAGYLSERFGGTVGVVECRRTFPGHSRETYLVTVELASGARRLVLRMDPPGGGIVPLPLEREYEVYRRLWPSAVPVAEPLWFDEGGPWFEGRPRMVRDLVPGSPTPEGLSQPGPEGDAFRAHYAATHATVMGHVHRLDWRALGFAELLDVPASPDDCAPLELEIWERLWHDARLEADPCVTRTFQWLGSELPPPPERVCLLKGNNGVGEEVWEGDELVALSDWELAALGDPASDWAFSQGIQELGDWSRTMACYEEAAELRIPERSIAWYRLLTLAKIVTTARTGLRKHVEGTDPRITLASFGLGVASLISGQLAAVVGRDIEEAAAMLPGRPKQHR